MNEKTADEWTPKSYPIPPHWEHAVFDDCFGTIPTTGLKIPQKEYAQSGTYPVIDQGADLIGGYTDDGTKVIHVSEPVLVFGDHTKCLKFIRQDFAPGADGIQVLASLGHEPKYLYYLYFSLRLPDRGYSRHFSFLKRSKFPIAPLNEQRRIVEKIENLFAELDKGEESLRAAKAQAGLYRQSLLKHAFEGHLTADWRAANTAEWSIEQLGDHLSFVTSGSRGWAKHYAETGDIFIRAQNLKHDALDLDDIAYVHLPKGKTEGVRTRVVEGDVLITITGANVTKTAPVKSDLGVAYVSQHVALCRPKGSLLTQYLYLFLIAEAAGRKQLNKAAYGAGKPGLNLANIKEVEIPIPKLAEQNEIISRLEVKLSILDTLENDIETQLAHSKALRQLILKRAFSGQLVSQDPADEPASKLLERIKAERKITPKAKRGKKANA
ncbi:restriction endonuclease subunit S [uncultured Hoeflea sp.]|uniref:restriction endonuclease subunit S n=1 Tax=uncultured Hoeflea sp. TaxID=538666 RepID=UPI0030EB8157|tara:strand:+ start:141657 stop:142970 length:1314 start_codon:yes stop_codon:yes gene_type:complete